ncbi:ABC transporter substrate-binding protein [Chitinivibrio alkaliphilus]|uniref:ABC-type transport system, substrate-binding subunit n=1 Tax=Chitinivibrio alkaliphilus ACht1 TaxID=1313304 RepID=U7D721_9BACT|nr:ABC transporter substrate-binding protein [Chitinivibrio alkaliphilus]ERP30872.1 ABC-type transport system, substrate-binding subunit [Chitinivibrio alkaliphilus ACht1]
MKKTIPILVVIVALVVIIANRGTQEKEEQALEDSVPTIVVADAKTTHHLNLYVAQELGLFEKHGVSVEIVDVLDLNAARDLVISGQADIFWSCPTVAIAAVANGAPMKIISQVKKPCTSVLLVDPDSPIQTVSDLDEKSIAGISPTCEAIISLTVAAREEGVGFNLERLAGGPALAALESGSVDAAILEEPHASIAELRGYNILFQEVSANIPCRTINARNAFLQNNSDAAKALIAAVEEANRIILEDPVAENIVDIAVEYTESPRDAIINGNNRLLFQTEIDQEGLSFLADELIGLGNIRSNPGTDLYAQEFKGITWN